MNPTDASCRWTFGSLASGKMKAVAGKVVRLRGSSNYGGNAFSSMKQPLESTRAFTTPQLNLSTIYLGFKSARFMNV